MAKNDNLTDYLTDLAEALRAKKGTTEPINPQDFRKEIESISGGGESGGSNYEYYALTYGWAQDLGFSFQMFSSLVKTTTSQVGEVIAPASLARVMNDNNDIRPTAVAIDMSLMLGMAGQQMTIKDTILGGGTTEEALAKYRITKEEFYSLE